ncbi:hypothetical protein ACJX0J_006534, partial [Zea mays]
ASLRLVQVDVTQLDYNVFSAHGDSVLCINDAGIFLLTFFDGIGGNFKGSVSTASEELFYDYRYGPSSLYEDFMATTIALFYHVLHALSDGGWLDEMINFPELKMKLSGAKISAICELGSTIGAVEEFMLRVASRKRKRIQIMLDEEEEEIGDKAAARAMAKDMLAILIHRAKADGQVVEVLLLCASLPMPDFLATRGEEEIPLLTTDGTWQQLIHNKYLNVLGGHLAGWAILSECQVCREY